MADDILTWHGVRRAIHDDNVGNLQSHLAAGGSNTLVDPDGDTVYHLCVFYGREACLQFVLGSWGTNVDAVPTYGGWKGLTALMLAAAEGKTKYAELLLGGGADAAAVATGGDRYGSEGLTAAAIAEKKGHAELARAIQPGGGAARAAVGLPPSASHQQLELWAALRWTEDVPWDPALATPELCAARDRDGNRAVHVAASAGSPQALQDVLRHSGDALVAPNDAGDLPLHRALRFKRWALVPHLATAATCKAVDADGIVPLELAIGGEAPNAVAESLIKPLESQSGIDTVLYDGDKRTCKILLRGSKLERLRQLAETYGIFLGLYLLGDKLVHISATCVVIFAEDKQANKMVALKFMRNEEEWLREQEMRQVDGQKLDARHVVGLLDARELDEDPGAMDRRLEGAGRFLLVMEKAEHDLSDVLSHYHIAGIDREAVVVALQEVGGHIRFMHETVRRIHGDLKPRNIVQIEIDGITYWILIDLDASCDLGSPAGQKVTSTGFFPPEMARRELDRLQDKPAIETVVATRQYEMWYFGLLMLQLCTPDAPTLWQSTQADNILKPQDMRLLAYYWDTLKLEKITQIIRFGGKEWVPAADLCLWLLQEKANRRPESMEQVLAHRFFNPDGKLRFFESIDETIDAFVERQTVELTVAINDANVGAVQELFVHGGVHIKMADSIIRSAFVGDVAVTRVLLEEIADSWPEEVRKEYLDQRTSLGYTAYMVAMSCGHAEIAELLAAKGCSTGLVNSSGKTGADLLRGFHNEFEQSLITPYKHGHNLHLTCETLEAYLVLLGRMRDEDTAAGIKLWNCKQAVYHFGRAQMAQLEAAIAQMSSKGFGVALHFTDFGCSHTILNTKGIRASVVGQLGGGVSVCLRSLTDFDWGQDWDKFTEAVGKALWGSKWYEVMSGEPWPDLEQKIASGEAAGSWPAARNDWGKWSSKLETVLLVAVPSESNRNPSRILPGRNDVFIIPRTDCTPGFEGDDSVYFSPKNIQAYLVLKPPTNSAQLESRLDSMHRVKCATEYGNGGMKSLQMSAISDNEKVIDIDMGEKYSPKITQFVMTIAQPVHSASVVATMHKSPLQPTFSSQQLWVEDVARFQMAEMKAAIIGVEQLLTQAYTMAYYYTTIEQATIICNYGIPATCDAGACRLKVCLVPPSAPELHWQSNAGRGFKQRVADMLSMDPNDVQVMVLLGVPTCVVEQAECVGQLTCTITEPADSLIFLQSDSAADVVYSKAHIAKIWALEATALIDSRQALIHVRSGKVLTDAFAGKTSDQIEREIQRLLAMESAASAATANAASAATTDEGVPPGNASEKEHQVSLEEHSPSVNTGTVQVSEEALRATLEKEHAAELVAKDKELVAKDKELVAKDKELEESRAAKDKELEELRVAKEKELEELRAQLMQFEGVPLTPK